MTERKSKILNLIVRDYIKAAVPVASESVARSLNLKLSPATVRNEVAELEEEGYLTRPHSSAGSVPLAKGYRIYVESVALVHRPEFPRAVRASVRARLGKTEQEPDSWASAAAAVLASLVGNLAIATFPKALESRVRHVEVVPLQGLLVLLIVVFGQTRLKRQLIRLHRPIEREVIQTSSRRLQALLNGRSWREINKIDFDLSSLENQVVDTATNMLRNEDRNQYQGHFLNGLGNLLNQPEFAHKDTVRSVIYGIENGTLAQAVLDEVPDDHTVNVVIGEENRDGMLAPLGVVIGQYGIPGEAVGALGAVGPVRMEYVNAVSSVNLMAGILNEMVEAVTGT
ncbi:MAG: heat-inducible transcriptional repressor HrcA [SAR202 cluster bacterium]|nr:heat-inducible transcriptional repressor HrcA [SAR202 cluster bacterium]